MSAYLCAMRRAAVAVLLSFVIPTGAWGALVDDTTAVFVAKTGNDANAGTLAAPFLTIAKGIASAGAGKNNVLIGLGTYVESGHTLPNGVSLYGGFDPAAGWTR